MKEFTEGVGVILKDNLGKFLLQHRDDIQSIRNPDKFAFFGGGLEPGESAIDAAVREIGEELDFYMNPRSLKWVKTLEGKGYASYIYEYLEPVNLEDLHLNGEGQGFGFFSRKEIALNERCLPYVKKILPCSCVINSYF